MNTALELFMLAAMVCLGIFLILHWVIQVRSMTETFIYTIMHRVRHGEHNLNQLREHTLQLAGYNTTNLEALMAFDRAINSLVKTKQLVNRDEAGAHDWVEADAHETHASCKTLHLNETPCCATIELAIYREILSDDRVDTLIARLSTHNPELVDNIIKLMLREKHLALVAEDTAYLITERGEKDRRWHVAQAFKAFNPYAVI